jgi:hypothetical protein
MRLITSQDDLRRRVSELEESLARQQALTAAERQRANRLEDVARVAWRLGLPAARRSEGSSE